MDALHTLLTIAAGAWAGYLAAHAATLPFGLNKYLERLRKLGKPWGCVTCMSHWMAFSFALLQHAPAGYAFLVGLAASALGTVLERHIRVVYDDQNDE